VPNLCPSMALDTTFDRITPREIGPRAACRPTHWSVFSVNAASGRTSEMRPAEIWMSSLSGGTGPKKITSVYADIVKEFRLPRQESYEEGKRYPLVVQTHGGPQASDKFGFGGPQN
jgi:hypothetical protein